MKNVLLCVICIVLLSPGVLARSVYHGGTPHDTVIDLSRDTLDRAIQSDPANSLWLLKFYAPWCGHCKKLAPVLDQVAPLVKGKMAIGKIDCTQDKDLCKQYGVRGYPTLKFARDGRVHDYPGTRKADSIIAFAKKMSSNPVVLIQSYQQALTEVASQSPEGVAFVAYHPQVKTNENVQEMLQSTHLTQVFGQLARKEQATANFALLSPDSTDVSSFVVGSDNVENGFVVRVEENVKPKQFDVSSNLSVQDLSDFVVLENFALVATIGPQNFHKLGKNGRPLVMGVVDGTGSDQVAAMKRDLADYATTGPTHVVNQYYFGWIDGAEWKRFLTQFNVTELPHVMVLDVPTKMYWSSPQHKTVRALLTAIQNKELQPHKANSIKPTGVLGTLHRSFMANMPYSFMFVVVIVFSLVMCILPDPKALRPPYNQQQQTPKQGNTKKAAVSKEEEEKAASATEQETESKKDK